MVRKSDAVVAAHVASFRRAHEAGARIAAGADSGTPLNFHGSLLPELELMVKYGMTPLEAIHSATSVAADALGLAGQTGRLAAGYAADLLAVAGEPAERIDALADVRLVLARGAIIKSP
jgi:imidazolonepropionase-like amidohydrolase